MRNRWIVGAAASALVLVLFLLFSRSEDAPPPAPAPKVPLPRSIAAIGDSITAGVGASPDRFDASAEHVWATGDATDDVLSHYERLLAGGASIRGQNHNFAVSGATMSDGPEQASRAVATGAEYVTILLGSNDVCAGSVDTMTTVAVFEEQFRTTLGTLARGLPAARFFVISIPDIHRLWETFRDDAIPKRIWDAAGTCGVMLDPDNADDVREAARQRNEDLNGVLESVCAEQSRCRFDNNAVFNYEFGGDLVAVDFFHPSHRGHEVLAELTWEYGYWPEL